MNLDLWKGFLFKAMAKLTCNCLNVILNISQNNVEVDAREVLGLEENENLFSDDSLNDAFIGGTLILVKLAMAGIEVQQQLLVKCREIGDYNVYKCINCDINTHAVHRFKGFERLFANKALLPEALFDKLRQSEDYSPMFKIILKGMSNGNVKTFEDNRGQASMFQRSLSDANSKVDDMVKCYLISEEEAMQERIRIFTEQQKEVFRKVKEKAHSDKQHFISIINKKEENDLQFSITDAMKDTKLSRSESGESDVEDPSPDLPQIRSRKIRSHRGIPILANSLPTNRNPSRVLSTKTASSLDRGQSSKMQRRTRSHNEDETLFDLDGFHENKNCEPFFESDDDSSGESSSLDNSGAYGNANRGNAGDRIYATSVPVSMPMYRPSERGFYESGYEVDVEPPPSPDRMAESIKALARSLHDSTSIFGELPGPRYNTMPYH